MDDLIEEALRDSRYWKKQTRLLQQGLKNVMAQIHAGTPSAAIYQAAKDCLDQSYAQDY